MAHQRLPGREGLLVVTGITSSYTAVLSVAGTKARADALQAVRAGRAALQHRAGCRSTATTRTVGFCAFRYSATPVSVPPVPTPATKMSTLPSVSSQISGPVVRRWISGLAGLEN